MLAAEVEGSLQLRPALNGVRSLAGLDLGELPDELPVSGPQVVFDCCPLGLEPKT